MLRRMMMLFVALVTVWTLPHIANGQGSVDRKLVQMEHDWAQAQAKGDAAVVEKTEAPEFVFTGPDGKVTGKDQDVSDAKTGNFKADALDLDDLKVHVYGSTAVVTGKATIKNGMYHGQDISGQYRFTDVWANKSGKWQVVASQSTAIKQ